MRLATTVILACMTNLACAQTILKAQLPPNAQAHSIFALTATEIAQSTAGRVKLQTYPAGTLATDSTIWQSVSSGTVEIAVTPIASLEQLDRRFAVYSAPFLFGDFGGATRFEASPASQQMLSALSEKGLTGIAYIHQSFDVLLAKGPITSPNMLKGQTFSTLPSSASFASVLNSAGGKAVQTSAPDLFESYTKGQVSGVAAPPQLFQSSNFSKEGGTITRTNHLYRGSVLVMNTRSLNSLLPADRAAVMASLIGASRALSSTAIAEYYAALRAAGSTKKVATPTPADMQAWRASAAQAWKNVGVQVGTDLFAVAVAAAGGTGGGGDPCPTLEECRCENKTCSKDCCEKK